MITYIVRKVVYALRVLPAVTRLTVYRRLEVQMGQKSDDSCKFDRSFMKVEVFLLTYDHNASADIGGWPRKIRSEQKSMRANFDVEVENDDFFFEIQYFDSK